MAKRETASPVTPVFPMLKTVEQMSKIDRQAEEMLFQLVKNYAQRQGITEQLKTENQMEWVGRMNNCKAQAEEVILTELIYV